MQCRQRGGSKRKREERGKTKKEKEEGLEVKEPKSGVGVGVGAQEKHLCAHHLQKEGTKSINVRAQVKLGELGCLRGENRGPTVTLAWIQSTKCSE